MNKTITCGIIGCGVIGPIHAQSFQSVRNVRIKWACDLVAARAETLAQKFGIPQVCTDYMKVLRDPEVDCVAVCTDHASHAEISCAALARGKHVLCEKALSSCTKNLDAMIRAGRRHPRLVFSGVLQHRFDPVFGRLKKHMERGLLGRMLACTVRLNCFRSDKYYLGDKWRGTWELEGGSVLINQALHYIDMGLWLMGGATSVTGFHANRAHRRSIDTEDTAAASLRFTDGALGSIVATCADPLHGWENVISLYGTEGTIDIADGAPARVEMANPKKAAKVMAELQAAAKELKAGGSKFYYGPSHPLQISDFVSAIRTGRKPFVPATAARHCVDVVLAVYESQKTGKTVSL